MLLLDPVNGITSIQFYRKVAAQGLGRTVLYLLYLGGVFAIAAGVAAKLRIGPAIDGTFTWLESSMPPLTFANGKVSSPATGPVVVRHPQFPELALVVDTSREEPVTPQLLEQNKAKAYLTQKALYLEERNGKMDVFDYSKSMGPGPIVIDGTFYRSAAGVMNRLLIPATAVMGFLMFVVWRTLTSLFYSLIAVIINSVAETSLAFTPLFNIAVYAQTLVIVLQIIFFFMPVRIPLFGLAAPVATGIYIWLALKAIKEPAPAAPAA